MDALGAISKAGGRFVPCKPGTKEPISRAWQKRPHGEKVARAQLERGGNIGLMTGPPSGWLVLLDVDQDAEDFELRFPEVVGWKVWRDNARERAKYIIRCPGALSRKLPGLEVLAGGAHGIVAGIHESGAEVLCELDGATPPTLTLDELAALTLDWTGQGYHAAGGVFPKLPDCHNPADLLDAAVRIAKFHMRHNIGFSLARALRDMGLSQAEATPWMLDYQTAVAWLPSATHAYGEDEAMRSLTGVFKHKPKRPASDVDRILDRLEQAIIAGDIAVSANVQKTLFGVTAIMRRCGKIAEVSLSVRELEEVSRVPRSTVSRHLEVLRDDGILAKRQLTNRTLATSYSLAPALTARMGHTKEVGAPLPGVSHSGSDLAADFRAEAAEYHKLQHEPVCNIGARVHPELAENDAEMASTFGAGAQRILAALAAGAPFAGVEELRDAVHLSARTFFRRLAALRRHGIVDHGAPKLAPDWRERLEVLNPRLVSYGHRELRGLKAARQRKHIHQELWAKRGGRMREIAELAMDKAAADAERWKRAVAECNTVRRRMPGPFVAVRLQWQTPKPQRPKLPLILHYPGMASGLATEEERLIAQLPELRAQAYGQSYTIGANDGIMV